MTTSAVLADMGVELAAGVDSAARRPISFELDPLAADVPPSHAMVPSDVAAEARPFVSKMVSVR